MRLVGLVIVCLLIWCWCLRLSLCRRLGLVGVVSICCCCSVMLVCCFFLVRFMLICCC